MRVEELIKELKRFPPDLEVVVRTTCPECSTDTASIYEVVKELVVCTEKVIIDNVY